MAKLGVILSPIAAVLFLSMLSPVAGYGGMVGGRTKISDVKTNKEVQELGKFCVEEFNKLRRESGTTTGGGGDQLIFSEVVEAEKQVVSGVKYYLKIVAINKGSVMRVFDSVVVVVKPWTHSKQLIAFKPTATNMINLYIP